MNSPIFFIFLYSYLKVKNINKVYCYSIYVLNLHKKYVSVKKIPNQMHSLKKIIQ